MKGVAGGGGGPGGRMLHEQTGGFSTNISTNSAVNFHLRKLQNHQSVEFASACVFDHAIYHDDDAQVTTSPRPGGVVKLVIMENGR